MVLEDGVGQSINCLPLSLGAIGLQDLWGWVYDLSLILASPNTMVSLCYGLGYAERVWLSTRLILGDPNTSIPLVKALSI